MNASPDTLCRHVGTCGGCTYQHLSADAYRALKRGAVADALARHGVVAAEVGPLAEAAPKSRRRATFKVSKIDGEVRLGFHAAGSHTIVDMRECRVLSPGLFRLACDLRKALKPRLADSEQLELYVVEAGNGFDVSLKGLKPTPEWTVWAARWAAPLGICRITAGRDILVELAKPVVLFGRTSVTLPPGAFLQPTLEGERLLQEAVVSRLGGARKVVDLFCGVGTFTIRVAETASVHAVDYDYDVLAALDDGARSTQKLKPITTERRDLFRHPLTSTEFARFQAVLLDPPRAGARRQASEIAASALKRVLYVSCNAESFAQDAKILVAGGFRLGTVSPVDQFLWSSHIELVADFSRE